MSTTTAEKSWSLDLAHTSIHFTVRHMVIAKVRGRFAKFDGRVKIDEKDLTRSEVSVTIDASSIDTGVANRDAHLRSADFFDVGQFPSITYVSRRVQKLSEVEYRVMGDVTIRGVTREVPLVVEYGGIRKDPWGNERVGFAATAVIDRKDFGLTWNQALEAGGVLVGDKVEIEIELQAVQATAQAAA